jgi:tetratricopeptide (TPR) repeat protein
MNSRLPPQAAQQVAQALALAERHARLGRAAEAERLCRQALSLDANSVAALHFLALLAAERNALDEAVTLLRRAAKLAPRDATLFNNLGSVLLRREDLADSEKALRRAISLKSDYPEAYYNLGVVLDALGRGEQALAPYRRAAALKPSYAAANVQIGVLLHKAGDNAQALAALDAAVAADPRRFEAHYYRGTVLGALGRTDEAIAALQAAAALSPRRYEAHYALGNALVTARKEEEALAAYRRAIELAPDFLPAHFDYNNLAWSMGQDISALRTYSVARSRVGNTPALVLAEADMRMRFNDAAGAEALLRLIEGDGAAVAAALGRALAQQSRFAESVEHFQTAVAAEPQAVGHRQDLGVALLRDHRFAAAREVLREALALAPFDQSTLAYLTLACRELGDSMFDWLVDLDRFVREYDLPVPAGFADIAAFNATLAEELVQLHTRKAEPLDQTLRHGTQTTGSLFAQSSRTIGLLQERIREVVADYIGTLPSDAAHPFLARRSREFDFVGSWSCRLHSSGYHTNHIHAQGWISSAYYVSLPDVVRSGEAEQGRLKFGESKFYLGEQDRPARIVSPAVGKLVLFPSYYWHGTVPFVANEARLAVAFDVAPASARSSHRGA